MASIETATSLKPEAEPEKRDEKKAIPTKIKIGEEKETMKENNQHPRKRKRLTHDVAQVLE